MPAALLLALGGCAQSPTASSTAAPAVSSAAAPPASNPTSPSGSSGAAPAHAAPAAAATDKSRPLFVESTYQRTFGAREPTPAGTVFTIRVVAKSDGNAFRLHRCGDPCKTSTTVALWRPDGYRTGEELSFRTTEGGVYYLWNQDVRTQKSIPAFTNEFLGKRIRIVYESGAIIEAWYTVP
jgi:hypothetical protein